MAIPVEIDDPADDRVADYRQIRERDLVGRRGLFIAEGEVVVRLLLKSPRYRPLSLLIDRKRIPALSPMLAAVEPQTPVYAAGQAVLDEIAGFHLHRGILALGAARAPDNAEGLLASLPARALVLGLIGVSNHDNMGGLFRNAAALGADAVLIDAESCDPLYRKAIRVSVGASLTVPWARVAGSPVAMLEALTAKGFEIFALTPVGRTPLRHLKRPPRAALLLGAEGPGLPQAVMQAAATVRIEMAGGFDSLNVATAGGVALHHLAFGTGA